MTSTGFWTSQPDRLGTAYRPVPGGLEVHDPPAGAWSRPPAFEDGGAGLLSTADDMHAFARMLLRVVLTGARRSRPGADRYRLDRADVRVLGPAGRGRRHPGRSLRRTEVSQRRR
jgi:CubicO group peptidase (beta-lactamase class C family)